MTRLVSIDEALKHTATARVWIIHALTDTRTLARCAPAPRTRGRPLTQDATWWSNAPASSGPRALAWSIARWYAAHPSTPVTPGNVHRGSHRGSRDGGPIVTTEPDPGPAPHGVTSNRVSDPVSQTVPSGPQSALSAGVMAPARAYAGRAG